MSASFAAKRVAIYARYSSSNQREASIEDQLRRCAEFVRGRGGQVDDALVFSDAAISGASLARPAFERLIGMVDAKGIDIIVTEDMSRISRDFADSAMLFRRLRHLGVPLIGVADGIDTSAVGSKVAFTLKSLMSDMYLDDLADKTKRGLEGRARAGYSTGGLPIGYVSVAETDGAGAVVGYRPTIDPAGAATVRRIFEMYLAGGSIDFIAKALNKDQVPTPRAKTRHRHKGWIASTVREILRNELYVGKRSYRAKVWAKIPGTNTRRPQKRAPEQVMKLDVPGLRIIDDETWQAVRARATAIAAKYKGTSGKQAAPGNRTSYPFSGLLFCSRCLAPMVISGGSTAPYYRCGGAKKRGVCSNKTSVREDVARAAIIGALKQELFTPERISYLRARIVAGLRERARGADVELKDRAQRLARTEDRIRGLLEFIMQGDQSASVRQMLIDLEAQARAEKQAIDSLKTALAAPVDLPSPDELLERARDLECVLGGDPVRARELLRPLFEGGRITMTPQLDGSYVASCSFLPLVAIADTAPRARRGATARKSDAATMLATPLETTLLEIAVPKRPDGRRKTTTNT